MSSRVRRGIALGVIVVLAYTVATWVQFHRRELLRLRAEARLSVVCQEISPGMSRDRVVALLGEPASEVTDDAETVRLSYLVEPDWLPDDALHIGGCVVTMRSNVVTGCFLSTERSTHPRRGLWGHLYIWFG